MAPLQGHTLGQRQKHYNELVTEALAKKTLDISKINFEEDDVDNMIKIDVACKERRVEYILDVFKSDDMMYVSRAINKSTWLITDPQYVHIINPEHMHTHLFPLMNAKAVTKLMLHIRRHLKDPTRVEAFYEYVLKQDNFSAALHWLGNCSLPFIEQVVRSHADDIPTKLMTRFCRQSFSILSIVEAVCPINNHGNIFNESKHFLKDKETAGKYLKKACRRRNHFSVNLNAKYTALVMHYCPEIMKETFPILYSSIHLPTFVKYLKTEEIKSFIMNTSIDTYNRVWTYETLLPFLEKLPRSENLDFLSKLYNIDLKITNEKGKSELENFFYAIENKTNSQSSKIYRWYRFAPFDTAFRNIKKMISTESDPEERHAMLIELMNCANYDFQHVKTVLLYYHDKHINEPYIHKKTFIDSLLEQHDAFRFDDATWNILNTLFRSSDTYIDSENEVQEALIQIIVREVLRDRPVHEVVEDKFKIESLVQLKTKLNPQEQDKLFNYLNKLLVKKISIQKTDCETGMRKAIDLLKKLWTIIKDWKRIESHHKFVIEKIVELCVIEENSTWVEEQAKAKEQKRKKSKHYKINPYVDLPSIYKMVTSYRKELFEKSFILNKNEEALLNALKHDPGLLVRHTTQVDLLRNNNEISLTRFLSKLRIYWSDTLAREWSETNKDHLQKLRSHKALIRGILTLMPHREAMDFIKTYAPDEKKINWNEANEIELSIVKHIANNMYLVRPQLSATVVLLFAKGDYLQYALFSLRAIYYNIRSSETQKYISLLLNAPVSIQKHGVRLVFDKYEIDEKIRVASEVWGRSRNASIRAILFRSMFTLLCQEKDETIIQAIWSVLGSFVDDLNEEEDKIIYRLLSKLHLVPRSVVGDFFKKVFIVLKPFTENPELDGIFRSNIMYAEQIIEYLDPEFVEKSLLNSLTNALAKYNDFEESVYIQILSAYLLLSKDLDCQMQKYNSLLLPIIEECAPKWAKCEKHLLGGFQCLLEQICSRIPRFVYELKMIVPVEILSNIKDAIQKGPWRIQEEYVMIRRWDLVIRFIEAIADIRKAGVEASWLYIRPQYSKRIAAICKEIILEDQRSFYATIFLIFRDVLKYLFDTFSMYTSHQLDVLYEMLEWEDCPTMYLLVLEMQPQYVWGDEERTLAKIKKKVYCHPSQEIHMHYFRRNGDHFPDEGREQGESDDNSGCEHSENTDNTEDSEEEGDSDNDDTESEGEENVRKTNKPTESGYRCIVM